MKVMLEIALGTSKRPTSAMLDQDRLAEWLTPPKLRAVTLVVVNLMSPYYLDRVGPDAREDLRDKGLEHAAAMKAMGFRDVIVPAAGFTEEDYVDLVHTSASGGEKLADAVAPAIRRMADELGYLK